MVDSRAEESGNSGRPWSRSLDEELISRFMSGESNHTIAHALARSEGAIRSRVIRLFLHLQGFAANKRFGVPKSAVSSEEAESIFNLREKGLLVQDIALDLGLDEDSVAGALLHLRLLEPVNLDEVSYRKELPARDALKSKRSRLAAVAFDREKPSDNQDPVLLALWKSQISLGNLLEAVGQDRVDILKRLVSLGEISETDIDHFFEIKRSGKEPKQ